MVTTMSLVMFLVRSTYQRLTEIAVCALAGSKCLGRMQLYPLSRSRLMFSSKPHTVSVTSALRMLRSGTPVCSANFSYEAIV